MNREMVIDKKSLKKFTKAVENLEGILGPVGL